MIDPRKLVPPNLTPLAKEDSAYELPTTEPPSSTGLLPDPGRRGRESRAHPLLQFSLRGHADELEAGAADTKPLLGDFVFDGQATMIYAAPNTGKTLILLHLLLAAIEQGRIDPNRVFYVNADDGSRGLAVKVRLLQDVGAHMLAPGRKALKIAHLVEMMLLAIEEGAARGTLILIDTLKKFTDPMDKKQNSAFAQVCRQYVMAGGTIIALGHTRKTPKADGTPQYQGTTDILEDFDAVYIAQLLAAKAGVSESVVRFKMEKKRADSPDAVVYAYSGESGISYEAKLASVHPVDPSELDHYRTEDEEAGGYRVAMTITELIDDGFSGGKMALAKAAAQACGVSQRSALAVLERYTGTTVGEHYWTFGTGPRGVRQFVLIPKA